MPVRVEYEGDLVHHYSSSGFKIRNTTTNGVYDDAWDLAEFNYEYVETDEKINPEDESSEGEEISPEELEELEIYAEAGRILLGDN